MGTDLVFDSLNKPIYSPKLYFVKLDVQACFDTIDQARLLEIIRNLLSEVLELLRSVIEGDSQKCRTHT